MLSTEDQEFISKEMKISLESIDSKFNEPSLLPYKELLESAISYSIHVIRTQNERGDKHERTSYDNSPAQNEINNHCSELAKTLSEDEVKNVLESLRHAFCLFAGNGLHALFLGQEYGGQHSKFTDQEEFWYPKVILDEELKPNDINELPSILTLYRGTDIQEFNSGNYGQSWSTCKDRADHFAFRVYAEKSWFKKNERIILETTISKEHVYYSRQQGVESEVAINTSKITCVKKIT